MKHQGYTIKVHWTAKGKDKIAILYIQVIPTSVGYSCITVCNEMHATRFNTKIIARIMKKRLVEK